LTSSPAAPARRPPAGHPRWSFYLGVTALAAVAFITAVQPRAGVLAYVLVGLSVALFYLARGSAALRAFIFAAIAVSLLPAEGLHIAQLRVDTFLVLAVLLVGLAERVVRGHDTESKRFGSCPRTTRMLRYLTLTFALAVSVGLVQGLAHGRSPVEVWNEFALFGYFALIPLIAGAESDERVTRELAVVLIAVTAFISFKYIVGFVVTAGTKRSTSDQQHFLNIGIPLLFAFLLNERRTGRRILYIILLAAMAVASYVTLTRAIWLYVPVSLAVILALLALHRRVRLRWGMVLALAATFAGFLVLRQVLFRPHAPRSETARLFSERAGSLSKLAEDPSLIARYDLALQVFDRWRHQPLFGTGLADRVGYRLSWIFDTRTSITMLDSSYLTILWKLGLLGLIPFVALFLRFLNRTWYVYRHARDDFEMLFALGTFAAFVSFIPIGLESGILCTYRFNLLWIVLIGVFERLAADIARRRDQECLTSAVD
jgi:O-antigen ligase